jgi:hypothetical protein
LQKRGAEPEDSDLIQGEDGPNDDEESGDNGVLINESGSDRVVQVSLLSASNVLEDKQITDFAKINVSSWSNEAQFSKSLVEVERRAVEEEEDK